jgi:hypothetical protein
MVYTTWPTYDLFVLKYFIELSKVAFQSSTQGMGRKKIKIKK